MPGDTWLNFIALYKRNTTIFRGHELSPQHVLWLSPTRPRAPLGQSSAVRVRPLWWWLGGVWAGGDNESPGSSRHVTPKSHSVSYLSLHLQEGQNLTAHILFSCQLVHGQWPVLSVPIGRDRTMGLFQQAGAHYRWQPVTTKPSLPASKNKGCPLDGLICLNTTQHSLFSNLKPKSSFL